MTEKLPALLAAVYMPEEVMVPPVAVQETEVLFVPVTLAVNCCCLPATTEVDAGFTTTLMASGAGLPLLAPTPWAHPTSAVTMANQHKRATRVAGEKLCARRLEGELLGRVPELMGDVRTQSEWSKCM